MAIDAGASALGLVGSMPSGPGVIEDETIARIAQAVPPPVATFLLTSETAVDLIVEHHRRTLTSTIQLVDALADGWYSELKRKLPAIKIVQAVHVRDDKTVEEAVRVSEHADALLLDSGDPGREVKVLGGTGRTHDWSLSRAIVERSRVPVYLAGGLNAGNVREALDAVRPFGLDVCSGVRTDGRLDPAKLAAFMAAAGA